MSRSIPLHRAKRKADWEYFPINQWNLWQKIASATNGWLAPANIISIFGAILTIIGLLQVSEDVTLSGIILILLGRLADVADGYVAELTGTKSPLGEWLDPSLDKVVSILAVIVFFVSNLVPGIVLAAIALQSIFNTSIGIAVARNNAGLHVSKEGKLAMAAIWATIFFFLLYNFWHGENGDAANVSSILAYSSFIVFLILGFRSSRQYFLQYQASKSTE